MGVSVSSIRARALAASRALYQQPLHPYSESLINAIPHPDGSGFLPNALPGEVPVTLVQDVNLEIAAPLIDRPPGIGVGQQPKRARRQMRAARELRLQLQLTLLRLGVLVAELGAAYAALAVRPLPAQLGGLVAPVPAAPCWPRRLR